MRLIDADALFSALNDAKWYDNADREIALDYVEDAPTVDAVQVVRCKGCEFWDDNRGILTYHACRLWSTVNSTRYTADMDFCSKGEHE
jgi:hypothetical protein